MLFHLVGLADVIYTRNFDSITLQQQQQPKRQEQHWIPLDVIDKGISVLLKAMLTPASIFQLFWRDAHMQRAKFFWRKAMRKIARRQNIYLAGFQRGQSSFIQEFPLSFFPDVERKNEKIFLGDVVVLPPTRSSEIELDAKK